MATSHTGCVLPNFREYSSHGECHLRRPCHPQTCVIWQLFIQLEGEQSPLNCSIYLSWPNSTGLENLLLNSHRAPSTYWASVKRCWCSCNLGQNLIPRELRSWPRMEAAESPAQEKLGIWHPAPPQNPQPCPLGQAGHGW